MFECMMTHQRHQRKGSRLSARTGSTWTWDEEDVAPLSEDSADEEGELRQCRQRERTSSFDVELPGAGVRRDRSALFERMREQELRRKETVILPQDKQPSSRAESISEDLSRIFDEASGLHTSLVGKLAQHNGLRQFAAEFTNRVPPLEFRMMIPELEASIEQVFQTLQDLEARLQQIHSTACGANLQLCLNLSQHVASITEKTSDTFEEQRKHLQKLAAASPLFSPVLSPELNKRLTDALSASPPSTAPASPSISTVSPRTSPRSSLKDSSPLSHVSPSSNNSPRLSALTCAHPWSATTRQDNVESELRPPFARDDKDERRLREPFSGVLHIQLVVESGSPRKAMSSDRSVMAW